MGKWLVMYGRVDGPCEFRVPYDVVAYDSKGSRVVKRRSVFGSEVCYEAKKFHRLTRSETYFICRDIRPCTGACDVEWTVARVSRRNGTYFVNGNACDKIPHADVYVADEKLPLPRLLVKPRWPLKTLLRLAHATGCDLDRVGNSTHRFFALLTREAHARDLFLPRRKITFPPYKGGHLIPPVPGVHENVDVYDFKSMYPSIVMAYDLKYPGETESPSMLATILRRLTDLRKEFPGSGKAFKLTANALVGMLGARHALPAPKLAAEVTAKGRELLKTARKTCTGKVVYGHTDSIFLVNGGVAARFPDPISLEHERRFTKLVLSDKMNHYYGLCDGELHVKGFENKNQCELEKSLQRMYMCMRLEGNTSTDPVWKEFDKMHPVEKYAVQGKYRTTDGWKRKAELQDLDLLWYREELAKRLRLLDKRKRSREDKRRELIMRLF